MLKRFTYIKTVILIKKFILCKYPFHLSQSAWVKSISFETLETRLSNKYKLVLPSDKRRSERYKHATGKILILVLSLKCVESKVRSLLSCKGTMKRCKLQNVDGVFPKKKIYFNLNIFIPFFSSCTRSIRRLFH